MEHPKFQSAGFSIRRNKVDPGPGSVGSSKKSRGIFGCSIFGYLNLWTFWSGPSGFSSEPIGLRTGVHLVSPYKEPSGLDFGVLYIGVFWISEFFGLDPQNFLPNPSDPGPGSTLFLHTEDPADWTFGCQSAGFSIRRNKVDPGPGSVGSSKKSRGIFGCSIFGYLNLWTFWSGPSGFSSEPIGLRTGVHLVSPYKEPSGLDFGVLYIGVFWISEFFGLDPQNFLPNPSDPGPGSTLFLHTEDPADWTFGCSIF